MTDDYPRASDAEYNSYVTEVSSVPRFHLAPQITTRIVPGKDLTLSFSSIAPHVAGAVHSHPHEQMILVLSGSIDILLAGKLYGLKKGDVIWVPSNLEHTGISRDEPCDMLEIFTPARKDFEEKLAAARAERSQGKSDVV